MNPHVVTIASTTTIQGAVDLMLSTHRTILPVIDQERRLIGTLGRSDVLRILLANEAGQ